MENKSSSKCSGVVFFRAMSILRFFDLIAEWQGKIFSYFILLGTFQICFELMMRYVFESPTTWGLEMSVYLLGTTYIMAGAYAERLNSHIKVDIIFSYVSPKTEGIINVILKWPLFFFFCGSLLWYSVAWFWEAIRDGLTSGSAWDPPMWPMRLAIVLGSVVLLLAGIANFMRDMAMAVSNRKGNEIIKR
jgi:TRAP-type mannitol/chloroaromatic compound transport system permease small subunit